MVLDDQREMRRELENVGWVAYFAKDLPNWRRWLRAEDAMREFVVRWTFHKGHRGRKHTRGPEHWQFDPERDGRGLSRTPEEIVADWDLIEKMVDRIRLKKANKLLQTWTVLALNGGGKIPPELACQWGLSPKGHYVRKRRLREIAREVIG